MRIAISARIIAKLCIIELIWTIRVVHYSLFSRVGTDSYIAYQTAHRNRITLFVLPLMLVEAVTALLLALQPPYLFTPLILWLSLALVIVNFLSTAFINMTQHSQLVTQFGLNIHHALVTTH